MKKKEERNTETKTMTLVKATLLDRNLWADAWVTCCPPPKESMQSCAIYTGHTLPSPLEVSVPSAVLTAVLAAQIL